MSSIAHDIVCDWKYQGRLFRTCRIDACKLPRMEQESIGFGEYPWGISLMIFAD